MRAVSALSVLIIDDDPDAAFAARDALAGRGYQAAVITDAMKALRFLMNEGNPDPALILIDLMVPGLAEIEADAYLRKPIDSKDLLSLVERYCGAPPKVRLRR